MWWRHFYKSKLNFTLFEGCTTSKVPCTNHNIVGNGYVFKNLQTFHKLYKHEVHLSFVQPKWGHQWLTQITKKNTFQKFHKNNRGFAQGREVLGEVFNLWNTTICCNSHLIDLLSCGLSAFNNYLCSFGSQMGSSTQENIHWEDEKNLKRKGDRAKVVELQHFSFLVIPIKRKPIQFPLVN